MDLGDIIIYTVLLCILYTYILSLSYFSILYHITYIYILYNIMYTLYIYYTIMYTHKMQLDFHMIQNVQTPPVGTPF